MGAARDPERYHSLVKLMWDWWGDSIITVIILAFVLIGLVTIWDNTVGRLF